MLTLKDIHFHIGKAVLLDGVSLAVAPGEVVAVVGPNGAGKSTLLKVAAGEHAATSGTVHLDDEPLAAISASGLAARRAVLPQQSVLQFSFTSIEVVMIGRTPHARTSSRAADEQAAGRALERVGVDHLADRRYPTLSGGEQQRVHLARTLAQLDHPTGGRARFLLLDEPTASLDLAHQHAVLQTARELAAHGVGVLVVLHDLNLAAQYADRLAVLRAGRLLADGSPQDILDAALVRDAFGIDVMIVPHPCQSCPLVVPAMGATGGDGLPDTAPTTASPTPPLSGISPKWNS